MALSDMIVWIFITAVIGWCVWKVGYEMGRDNAREELAEHGYITRKEGDNYIFRG